MRVIEIKELVKCFKKIHALNSISFSVKKGEVFGLLGPNGAGKSTLIRCLLGLLRPSSGTATVFGHDIMTGSHEIRKKSSLLPQEASCVEMLTARENIAYHGGIHMGDGINKEELENRVDELLTLVELKDRANDLTKTFSGGMKRKVLIASALVMQPDLIFLDEPTTAVDILGAQIIRKLIKNISTEQKKTIFLTTHDLTDINELCDRVGILANGKLLAVGKPETLEQEYQVEGITNLYSHLVRMEENKLKFSV